MKSLEKLSKLQMDRAVLRMSDRADAQKKIKDIDKQIDDLTKPHWMVQQ